MYGVMSPSVSPGSSQRFTSVTWIPSVIVPSCAARAGTTPASRRTTIITARTKRPTLIRHLRGLFEVFGDRMVGNRARAVKRATESDGEVVQDRVDCDTLARDGDPAARPPSSARACVLLSCAGAARSAC